MAYFGYILMTMFEMNASHYYLAFNVPHADNFDRDMAKRVPNYDKMKDAYNESDTWRIELPAEEDFDFGAAFPNLPETKEPEKLDTSKERLHNILPAEGDIALFTYDFGDEWEIELCVEEIFRKSEPPASALPKALEGEGFGIIENGGGPDGLKK